ARENNFLHLLSDIYAEPDPLVEYKGSPYANSKGFTKLMKWVLLTNEHPELLLDIEFLIKSNPEILDKQNEQGWTALMMACRNSKTWSSDSTVELLITYKANLDLQTPYGSTALILACANYTLDSSETTIKLLLNAGANPDVI